MMFALITFAILTFILLVWVLWKIAGLEEWEEELDKYSIHLDEKANMLARWEDELLEWEKKRKEVLK